MQKLATLLIIAFSYGISFAQPRIIYRDKRDTSQLHTILYLDSTHMDAYINGSTPDSKDCVFGGEGDTVGACFEAYLHAMHNAILKHGIVWNAPINVWSRGYFNERGEVDAIVIHIADSLHTPQLTEALT